MDISVKCYLLVVANNIFQGLGQVWGKILKILSEIACDDHVTDASFDAANRKILRGKKKVAIIIFGACPISLINGQSV